jgi:hypothetical protein
MLNVDIMGYLKCWFYFRFPYVYFHSLSFVWTTVNFGKPAGMEMRQQVNSSLLGYQNCWASYYKPKPEISLRRHEMVVNDF